jgi:hypothetical protein
MQFTKYNSKMVMGLNSEKPKKRVKHDRLYPAGCRCTIYCGMAYNRSPQTPDERRR